VSLIGQGVRRLEDRPLLTGAGRFAADVSFPHQLFLRVVRSSVAFGRLRGIDTPEAARAPGVVAVWTSADIAGVPPIDFRMTRVEGLEAYRQPILAREFVRYVGEPVACVFAEDAYLAEDAAELVAPEIEELAPIVSATAPPSEFVRGISSEAATISKGYGDLNRAFRQAHAVINSSSRSGATPACRSRRAGRLLVTTPAAIISSCTAPPRCRTTTAMPSPRCWAWRRARCIYSRDTSAAGSASGASCIPRTCWSASRRAA
jgi:CO/xanthine dehydrogenase Mo-binding subunit